MGKAEEKVLEIIVLNGRIKAKEGEVSALANEILKAQAGVDEAKGVQNTFQEEKAGAIQASQLATTDVMHKEQAVKNAQSAYEASKAEADNKRAVVASFTRAKQAEVDEAVGNARNILDKVIAVRDNLNDEIAKMKEELSLKQETLKEDGVVLDFTAPRAPKTHQF